MHTEEQSKKDVSTAEFITIQQATGVQSTPCTCSPININMENAQKPLGRRVASLSDKVVAFLLRDALKSPECEGDGEVTAIVSPDLQRATNTEPDRERNCSENAPSCVITETARTRNSLFPLTDMD